MKKIYLFQHFIGGDVVEQLASFDKELLIDHAHKVEKESPTEGDDVWIHEDSTSGNPGVIYYSYDQYIRMGCYDDEDEIVIAEIDLLD